MQIISYRIALYINLHAVGRGPEHLFQRPLRFVVRLFDCRSQAPFDPLSDIMVFLLFPILEGIGRVLLVFLRIDFLRFQLILLLG